MKPIYVTLAALVLPFLSAFGQTTVKVSGLAYMDYDYVIASPDAQAEGDNGFGYRRLYLTSDFGISDDFSARARLEANDGSTTAQGRPSPFVKDLYLRWSDSFAEDHDLYIGISSPPSFTVAEKLWGYRSVEKTLQDRTGVVSSRDFGVVLRGPITHDGSVRYGVMIANNNGVRGESDRHKRVYGQLEIYPSKSFVITLGGDYASYGDDRDRGLNGNAMIAHTAELVTVGLEGFYNQTTLNGIDESGDLYGVSLFGRAKINNKVTALGRFERVETTGAGVEDAETFFVGGVALSAHENVEFIPNVIVSKLDSDDTSFVSGRVTLFFKF